MSVISLEDVATRQIISNHVFHDSHMERFSIVETVFSKCSIEN